MTAQLVLGPLLRHVGATDATVWVETDRPCEVEVLGCREPTWTVAGHHYALVPVEGLSPDSCIPYEVHLDGAPVWPPPDDPRPACRIRTLPGSAPPSPTAGAPSAPGGAAKGAAVETAPRAVRLAFGSCRFGNAAVELTDGRRAPDALAAYARELAATPEPQWPDAVLLLGDQVYADETSAATQRRIAARRDITTGAKEQVADFEEYTWLYRESWTDPDVRWLLSTVPSSMIFDDHDVRDDWNTSQSWRRDMQRTDWWQERIVGGLSSYWVYQHLGNLGPAELQSDELFQKVRRCGGDAEPLLREFAARADSEADGGPPTRWSYRRDFGRVRLVMVDSRCGRVLTDGRRSMMDEDEFAWVEQQVDGDVDHLLIGTSLPWLLARALHDIEAWDEVLADGNGRRARVGEWLRRAADLEHWAAFRRSFDRLAALLDAVARRPGAPATICVLSGDVHHSYMSEAHFPHPEPGDAAGSPTARVYQLTCSPLHNMVPLPMKFAFRVAWSRLAERFTRRLLALVSPVPRPAFSWRRLQGPFFGNAIAEFVADGRHAEAVVRKVPELRSRRRRAETPTARLRETARLVLSR